MQRQNVKEMIKYRVIVFILSIDAPTIATRRKGPCLRPLVDRVELRYSFMAERWEKQTKKMKVM